MIPSRAAVWTTAVLALAAPACGSTGRIVRDDPGVLLRPSAYAGDFALDQTVTAVHAEGSETFRAVLEKRGDRLVMIGLGPHGGRAFVLTQRDGEIEFESHLPRELPFPPRFMLLDVHRTWLTGLDVPPPADGELREQIEGEERIDTWQGGRLLARSYRRLDGAIEGRIQITYEGGLSPDRSAPPPSRVTVDNGWFGYRLEIRGITLRPLE
jgi:hypothetical protein